MLVTLHQRFSAGNGCDAIVNKLDLARMHDHARVQSCTVASVYAIALILWGA